MQTTIELLMIEDYKGIKNTDKHALLLEYLKEKPLAVYSYKDALEDNKDAEPLLELVAFDPETGLGTVNVLKEIEDLDDILVSCKWILTQPPSEALYIESLECAYIVGKAANVLFRDKHETCTIQTAFADDENNADEKRKILKDYFKNGGKLTHLQCHGAKIEYTTYCPYASTEGLGILVADTEEKEYGSRDLFIKFNEDGSVDPVLQYRVDPNLSQRTVFEPETTDSLDFVDVEVNMDFVDPNNSPCNHTFGSNDEFQSIVDKHAFKSMVRGRSLNENEDLFIIETLEGKFFVMVKASHKRTVPIGLHGNLDEYKEDYIVNHFYTGKMVDELALQTLASAKNNAQQLLKDMVI